MSSGVMALSDERALFEAWAKSRFLQTATYRDAWGEPKYHDHIECMWEGWQAGRASLVPQWQPIETAPKDGTRILVSNGVQFAAVFWWPRVWMGDTHNGMRNPTSWMQIPSHAAHDIKGDS
jgi:hypothetical protein